MSRSPTTISNEAAGRFILGLQGLWPGRRWVGKDGTSAAIRALGAVQVDPMTVVARSHDLALHARVVDYRTEDLNALLYSDRQFFDYGGCVHIYPIDELPYWSVHMARRRADPRPAAFFAEHGALTDEVRQAVRERGPLGSGDLEGNARVASYRARKDTGLALYNLWLTGELMTHHRDGFQRIYDLRERVAPAGLDRTASEHEAEEFFARQALQMLGLHTGAAWTGLFAFLINRKVSRAESRDRLERMAGEGICTTVQIEGQHDTYYFLTSDAPLLNAVWRDEIPEAWQPADTTVDEEAVFLSPLDSLLARKRTQTLFNFEYLWEVYKPAEKRRWGYYTMPILWGDRLVGRLDPKLDRKTATLQVNGFWLEDEGTADNPAFVRALARGMDRFARFHQASSVELPGVHHPGLRTALAGALAVEAA